MQSIKKMFTEASIVSAVVVYSYIVYLVGELGYLNAYGIGNASSLITLEVQNIIFGFLQALAYFLIVIVIMVAITFALEAVGKGKKNKLSTALRRKVILLLLTSLVLLTTLPMIEDITGKLGVAFFSVTLFIFFCLTIFLKLPGKNLTLIDLLDKIIPKALSKSDKASTPDSSRLFIFGLIVSVIYIPFVNYLVNYNSVSIPSYEPVRVVAAGGSEYVLIKQYSDKNLLVKIENNFLRPDYVIKRGAQLDNLNYVVENRRVDNNMLYPRPEYVINLNNEIKRTLNKLFPHQ